MTIPFLDLGSAPPSNAYLGIDALFAPEVWYPLRVLVCEVCWLAQTEDYAGRESLFSADYSYFSSFSESWLAHAKEYVDTVVKRFDLGGGSLVVEIGSNDGYLLQYVKAAGISCYGIEPTSSTSSAARGKGIEVVQSFFGMQLAQELAKAKKRADLIVANNVLAHVPCINDFVAGVRCLLKYNGVATFEFPYLLQLVNGNQFDTVYHEHYSYLSLVVVERIFRLNGLAVFNVEKLRTHGGSLRVFAQRIDGGQRPVSDVVRLMIQREIDEGVTSKEWYIDFQSKAERVKNDFFMFLLESKKNRLKIGAYGAAAKGNTLLNFAGVRPDLLPYVVDRNPAKQGRYMPGSRIPIVDETILRQEQPDRVIVLPWNIRDEIVSQLSYAREWGAKFVVTTPLLEVF